MIKIIDYIINYSAIYYIGIKNSAQYKGNAIQIPL